MDLAHGLPQLNAFNCSVGSSSRIVSCWFRCRGSSYNFLGETRVYYKSCSLRRGKCGSVGGCVTWSSARAGYFGDFFHLSQQKRSLDFDFLNPQKLSNVSALFKCQTNDSLACVDGNSQDVNKTESSSGDEQKHLQDYLSAGSTSVVETNSSGEEEKETYPLEDLRELLQETLEELEAARLNSTMFEEKAQRISESAIALKDEAESARRDVTSAVSTIQEIVSEENIAKEAVQKAIMALSMAEARLQLAIRALSFNMEQAGSPETSMSNEEEALLSAQEETEDCRACLANCEAELRRIQARKAELQKEVDRLSEVAEKAQLDALKAEEDVANIMHLAEQAVAYELEATQHVNDAELALQRAEKTIVSADAAEQQASSSEEQISNDEPPVVVEVSKDVAGDTAPAGDEKLMDDNLLDGDVSVKSIEELKSSDDIDGQANGKLSLDSQKEAEVEMEKSKNVSQAKKQDMQQKDLTKDSSSPLNSPKALLNKSSRFFSASFFSFKGEGKEVTPASVFHGLITSARNHAPKLVIGILFLAMGVFFLNKRAERNSQMLYQPDIITGIEEVTSTAKPVLRAITRIPKSLRKLMELLPQEEIKEEEASLFDVLWLLLASVVFVPIFQKIPGGSPVLGYLAAGILIGPYGLSIIRHVHGTKAIAEFGVVFLLFNIGLELSVERLSSMKKYVFGLGSAQVLVTAVAVGLIARFVSGLPGPASIVIGNGLALSSTAVVLQVLQERGESTSRHGRATFSVLLFQDLAVVVLLILIPLISPNSSKGGIGFQAIAEALGVAAVKAVVAITAIIAGGRLFLRPIYKQIAENQNAEIFSANTLLVILGTSLLTARAGLSMALGAFLAGLLLAETEFSLQVESDIAPYRGLLLGLFFMTVGMSIDPKLLISNFPVIVGTLSLLIAGKALLVALVGRVFGISSIPAIRVGLLLAPGGEFAFVAFGEAVNQGILSSQLSSLLFLVVGLSMALTPWLAAGGQFLASRFEQNDVRSLLPVESETDDLQDHIILCGFGRVGQIIAQLLSERLIPFVALDIRSDRVAAGRALDLPIYFGDAGSREVLHKVGAERACAAAITLDTPGANYRTVWALSKYFPNVKTFVRAHDVDHGINLEKAGATAVVPETLEPSLQLAAAVLAQTKLPMSEIAATINEFRTRHLSELTELCETSGSSLGYGFSRVMSKPRPQTLDPDENEVVEGTLAI
ncbi:K(+) efflux antiporter 2, chloroplastic [Elaeis guineensis]|uniref:K(+) efflux antiporter 2, chloroplastic n=1 Tax=Elaeis guineensis var. tenera TaxID=51953 RepID=A0A6I9RZN1_ELAGV|nr:K(+) efflux antiporter 2, chloroplastic [Elaeis guineensis]XP_010934717.1 K(+) efflux antiporter 2, chloroplastic [Elaeis guineensis]XP_010934718.1 K(+) efflux antiporter 2, chloroplastic [Elaeis guineensis]XP_010934720.1 K(+) efflux antiporter 2, chloroplastic [Elaeis guineensis]XP_010934721.1 K(+) efflux antiporter 2, chloroplastic [Elaeis guineensis]